MPVDLEPISHVRDVSWENVMAIDSRAPPFLIRVHPPSRVRVFYGEYQACLFRVRGLKLFSITDIAVNVKLSITTNPKTSLSVRSAALWILWSCRGCNCVILLLVFTLFLWLWLEARGFFIDYSAGFRLRHSGS